MIAIISLNLYKFDYRWKNIVYNIGSFISRFHGEPANECLLDIPSEQWYFFGNDWTIAGQNEIKLECLTGKL